MNIIQRNVCMHIGIHRPPPERASLRMYAHISIFKMVEKSGEPVVPARHATPRYGMGVSS